jgi:hypothetical protein
MYNKALTQMQPIIECANGRKYRKLIPLEPCVVKTKIDENGEATHYYGLPDVDLYVFDYDKWRLIDGEEYEEI